MRHRVSENIDRVRRTEYIGENRCIPCTATNLAIAAIASMVIKRFTSNIAAIASFVVSVILIYLRGYLVPYTPVFTKRYFPEWLLSVFDNHDAHTQIEQKSIDIETELVKNEVITECENTDDLCLSEEFRGEWWDRIDSTQNTANRREEVTHIFDIEKENIHFNEYDTDGAFVALAGDNHIGQWESRAAFRADIAAAELLQTRIEKWNAMPVVDRSQLLGGLRLFLDACPACGEDLAFGEDTVESCCRSINVVEMTCTGCDSRLFEVENSGTTA